MKSVWRYWLVVAGGFVVGAALMHLWWRLSPPQSVPTQAFAPTVEDQPIEQRLDWLFGSVKPFSDFFRDVQDAIRRNDAQAIAALIAYPLHNGEDFLAYSRDDFVAAYDHIITPHVREVVLTQTWTGLFANVDGIMFGDGEVWATAVCPAHPHGGCDNRSRMLEDVNDYLAFPGGAPAAESNIEYRITHGQSGRGCSNMSVRLIAINQEQP